MSFSPHEVYSRSLLGAYGCPLWIPEPQDELPEDYRREGLQIGDVGIVSPIDGGFDVLFNITLSRDTQPHPRFVQEGFTPVILEDDGDITRKSDAVAPHSIISSASVELVSQDVISCDQRPSRADYEFSLSTEDDGAVLILPEGAQSCILRNEQRFLEAAIQHGVHWYECATKTAGRLVDNDSLYLITGFHKARSWSLAAAGQFRSSIQNRRSVKFTVGQINTDSVTAEAYVWAPRAAHAFMPRVGPSNPYENSISGPEGRNRWAVNQTVFIRGFRIMINKILFLKTVSVETPQGTIHGFWTYLTNQLRSATSEPKPSSDTEGPGPTDPAPRQDFRGSLHVDSRLTIDDMPAISKTFHPGDAINRYMLKEEPHAMVAITHDRLWIEMLQMGLLELADFSRKDYLQEVLSKNYRVVVENSRFLTVTLSHDDRPYDYHPLSEEEEDSSQQSDRTDSIFVERGEQDKKSSSAQPKNTPKTTKPCVRQDNSVHKPADHAKYEGRYIRTKAK